MFLLPLLKIYFKYVKSGFVNCYIGDIDKPQYDEHLFILIKQKNDVHYVELTEIFTEYKFIDVYEVYEPYHMFVFDFPKEFKNDKNKFLGGAYSKMSEKAKRIIAPNNTHKDLVDIFNKDFQHRFRLNKIMFDNKDLKKGHGLTRNDEVLSIPELDDEIFNIKTHFEWK